jgi:hypothetical protein
MAVADQNYESVTVTIEPPAERSAAALIRNAVHQHLAVGNLDAVRWFCQHSETPEDVLLELCDRGVCLDELGHRRGPRRLLEKLAGEFQYPEAVISLGLELFQNAAEPATVFADFLRCHGNNGWLLETLARRGGASSQEKDAAFEQAVAGQACEDEVKEIRRVRNLTERARVAVDAGEMERLFAAAEPDVWLALAANPAAPSELLSKLLEIEGVRHARNIRTVARHNLDSR